MLIVPTTLPLLLSLPPWNVLSLTALVSVIILKCCSSIWRVSISAGLPLLGLQSASPFMELQALSFLKRAAPDAEEFLSDEGRGGRHLSKSSRDD